MTFNHYNLPDDVALFENLPLHLIQSALSRQIKKYGLEPDSSTSASRYCLALSIVQYLRTLLSHNLIINNYSLQNAYRGMLSDWETIARIHTINLNEEHFGEWYH